MNSNYNNNPDPFWALFVVLLSSYLVASFVAWNLFATEWQHVGRITFVVVLTLWVVGGFAKKD